MMLDDSRRLSFGDTALHQPEFPDIHHVLQAASQPSIEHFQRALQHLDEANHARFVKIKEVAREQHGGCGKSELRRLKRQFASHKNSYMLFDVKQSFLEGVAEGLPDGSEEAQMPAMEQEVEKHSAEVKQHKEHNAQLQAEVEELIESISATYKEFGQRKAEVASHLECLLSEEAQRNATAPLPMPELEDGPDEAACKALLVHEAAQARTLEAALAAEQAEGKELLAAIRSEEEELQALREQIEELETDKQEDRTVDMPARLAESAAWLDAMTDLMAHIGGVQLVSAKQNPVHFRLTTYIPSSPGGPEAFSVVHDLKVEIDLESCQPQSATLEPSDFAITDILDAARAGGTTTMNLAILVQEIQGRVVAHQARLPSFKEAQDKYTLIALGEDSFEVQLAGGVRATLVVPREWPGAGMDISLAALTTASGVAMSESVVQKVQEGSPRSLLSLLDHVSEAVSSAFA